ncbi:DUF397 domain-containing protein [Streptomyces antibioticus]|uniref:DUF397 domain-containing protein n=1 Tax=Streptomyces antibioticus TaxID=1890 RepID=UPI0033F9BAC8
MSERLKWFKSSYSDSEGGNCVEVALSADVHVRDSKVPDGPALRLAASAWEAFLAAAR